MFMCCHQSTGQNNYTKAANKSLENAGKFKFLERMATNPNTFPKKLLAE
jgi:hypothetical protein